MKSKTSALIPEARREGIITKEVDGELLIYDRERDRAHCLNFSAAAIWTRCDGRTSVPEIARTVTKLFGVRIEERLVYFALKQFSSHRLLVGGYDASSIPPDLTRRTIVRRLGVGFALVPLITSITAPTAFAAISCGGPCTGGPGRGSCPAGCLCSVTTNTCVVA
ncbi:MAG TPA: PqqD family protein [Pyrinomonadaceae bacterium]|nr:PqqD family protein [Pyrinomonadaceae bacterium]